MLKLAYSEAIGKILRHDDLGTLGVSSQAMAEQAIAEALTAQKLVAA